MFARLGDLGPFGQGDLTVEAVVYGAVIALKVTLLMLITTLASLAVDPDELLRALRRTVVSLGADRLAGHAHDPGARGRRQRLAEAQRTRPAGAPRGARARVALLSAVVGGSLDRAMDVAATLELRGFAAARRPPRRSLVSRRPGIGDLASRSGASRAVAARGRATISRSPARPSRSLALGLAGTARRSGLVRRLSARHMPVTAATGRCLRGADRGSLAAVRRPPGDRPMNPILVLRSRHLPLPGRRDARRSRTSASSSSRASSACSRDCPATASRRCCAPPAASCRTFTADASPARSRSPASTRASTARRSSGPSRARCFRIPRRSS